MQLNISEFSFKLVTVATATTTAVVRIRKPQLNNRRHIRNRACENITTRFIINNYIYMYNYTYIYYIYIEHI